jgi:hypothetical protein
MSISRPWPDPSIFSGWKSLVALCGNRRLRVYLHAKPSLDDRLGARSIVYAAPVCERLLSQEANVLETPLFAQP